MLCCVVCWCMYVGAKAAVCKGLLFKKIAILRNTWPPTFKKTHFQGVGEICRATIGKLSTSTNRWPRPRQLESRTFSMRYSNGFLELQLFHPDQ